MLYRHPAFRNKTNTNNFYFLEFFIPVLIPSDKIFKFISMKLRFDNLLLRRNCQ